MTKTARWLIATIAALALAAGPLLAASPAGAAPAGGLTATRIVGVALTPAGTGAWLVTASGHVVAETDASGLGTAPAGSDIVGIAATPRPGTSQGFWLVSATGQVFSFGDARSYGSMAGKPLDAPIVGMAATPTGGGYWLVGADGGVFSFGDARFYGSVPGHRDRVDDVTSIAVAPGGHGYWLSTSRGSIFGFGGLPPPVPTTITTYTPTVGIASTTGYWLVTGDYVEVYGTSWAWGRHVPFASPPVAVASTATGNELVVVSADGGHAVCTIEGGCTP